MLTLMSCVAVLAGTTMLSVGRMSASGGKKPRRGKPLTLSFHRRIIVFMTMNQHQRRSRPYKVREAISRTRIDDFSLDALYMCTGAPAPNRVSHSVPRKRPQRTKSTSMIDHFESKGYSKYWKQWWMIQNQRGGYTRTTGALTGPVVRPPESHNSRHIAALSRNKRVAEIRRVCQVFERWAGDALARITRHGNILRPGRHQSRRLGGIGRGAQRPGCRNRTRLRRAGRDERR